jgi:hypothetical protein
MTSLELILSKIPEKSQCPPPQAAGRKTPKIVSAAAKRRQKKRSHEKVRHRRTKFVIGKTSG